MTQHEHQDKGGGFCECGAERCSRPTCDAHCVHGDWLEPEELAKAWRECVRLQMASGTQLTISRELLRDLRL